jgi:hypothetical protein
MRRSFILFLFASFIALQLQAQNNQTLNPDQVVVSENTVTVKGVKIPYNKEKSFLSSVLIINRVKKVNYWFFFNSTGLFRVSVVDWKKTIVLNK